ncbi:MAG: AhpC/TSA family protein, partial [Planctomycetota bacterium]
ARGVTEVVVFASENETVRKHHAEIPFDLVADPQRHLYAAFGVEKSVTALLHPVAFWAAIKGTIRTGSKSRSRSESALGLPADFLLDATGRIQSLHYGKHASDHWEVDEVLSLARA